MPTLPAIDIPQAAVDRVTAAFTGEVDENNQPLTPQQAYRRWVIQNLKAKVLQVEAIKIDQVNNQDKRAKLANIEKDLPNA